METEEEMIAAVLHDVLEDTKLTLEDLNANGSAGTVIIDFDGLVSEAVMPEDFMTLRKILKTEDPAILHGFHPSWAPFRQFYNMW